MATIKNGESTGFNIPKGEKFVIKNNVPLRLEIETIGGTIIEGVLPPNNSLMITGGNDLVKCDCHIEKNWTKDLSILE